MERTTNGDRSAEEFYDGLASHYDAMTGFEKRFAAERPRFERLISEHRIATAVDAGCGTGFHSILLSQLGVRVTSVDVSPEMLERTSANAKRVGVDVHVVRSGFEALAEHVPGPVDALFCLGNSLVHLPTSDSLERALRNFRQVLRPGGLLIIQILNYDRILSDRRRVQNITDVGTTTYVRFYDFVEGSVTFNILTIDRSGGQIEHELRSTRLHPIQSNDLRAAIERAGFGPIDEFGSLAQEPFDATSSRDLVVIAQRTG